MYCPNCGTENPGDGVKFCRGCGEDLRLTAQAIQKQISWPAFLATKLDNSLGNRYQQNARDGGINIFIGIVCVLLGVWHMLTGEGALIFWVVVLLCCVLGIGVGIYDVLIYKRSVRGFPRDVDRLPGDLSIYKSSTRPATPKAALNPTAPTDKIRPPEPSKTTPPPSVTEPTTRHLEARLEQANEKT